MSALDRKDRTSWVYAGLLFFLTALLMGFHLWLTWFQMADLAQRTQTEQLALQSLKTQQNSLLGEDLRDLFESYSAGLNAVETLFIGRDEVFTGDLDEDQYEPVVILDLLDFFDRFQERLGKSSVLSDLSIDRTGQISFLVQTTSYLQAARQMAVFQQGFLEEQEVADPEDPDVDVEPVPPLLVDIQITSVARNELFGKEDQTPQVLRQSDSSYDFVVQAKINPEYYFYQLEQKELVQESADSTDDTSSAS